MFSKKKKMILKTRKKFKGGGRETRKKFKGGQRETRSKATKKKEPEQPRNRSERNINLNKVREELEATLRRAKELKEKAEAENESSDRENKKLLDAEKANKKKIMMKGVNMDRIDNVENDTKIEKEIIDHLLQPIEQSKP
jgi:hypothetical protein